MPAPLRRGLLKIGTLLQKISCPLSYSKTKDSLPRVFLLSTTLCNFSVYHYVHLFWVENFPLQPFASFLILPCALLYPPCCTQPSLQCALWFFFRNSLMKGRFFSWGLNPRSAPYRTPPPPRCTHHPSVCICVIFSFPKQPPPVGNMHEKQQLMKVRSTKPLRSDIILLSPSRMIPQSLVAEMTLVTIVIHLLCNHVMKLSHSTQPFSGTRIVPSTPPPPNI